MKKMIIIMIIISGIGTLFAETRQLKDFDEIMTALKTGENVRVVIHFGKCEFINGNEIKESSPDAIGGMNIDVFEYFAPMSIGNPKAFVVFSHSSLINYGGFIYNYVKFKVTDDNKVKVTAQYVDVIDYELEMDENFFSEINDGKNEGAVYFYQSVK